MNQKFPPSICQECGVTYTPTRRDQKYCSRACYYKQPRWNENKKGTQVAWNRQDLYSTCEFCGETYKIVKSMIGRTRFCSRTCQNRWIAANRKKFGSENPAFKDGSSVSIYRREAFRIHGRVCNRCDSTENLLVHHIDHNRKNNPMDGSNWEVLCKRCHQLHHNAIENLPKREPQKESLGLRYTQKLYTKRCVGCGNEYHPTYSKQKYCSRSCANKSRYSSPS